MADTSVNLLTRWRAGDQTAAALLFQRYAQRLIGLAHQRLSTRLAGRVAAEDVVQSVYCSFFTGARNGRYVLENSGDLWRLLVAITIHKVHHLVKRHTAAKRSVRREQTLGEDNELWDVPADLLNREPSPEESLLVIELLEHAVRGLEPLQRRMVEMRLQGHAIGEITAATQRSRATVQRVLERVRQQLLVECGVEG